MSVSEESEQSKSLRDYVERERLELFDQLYLVISDWKDHLPDLRHFFQNEEIERLLSDFFNCSYGEQYVDRGKSIIDFTSRSGREDKPDAKPLNWRTIVREFFQIHERLSRSEECGLTLFHVACDWGYENIVERFLELGQDPDCLEQRESVDSPLHLALANEHEGIFRLLLSRGADPNLANKDGSTPLQIIFNRDSYDFTTILLEFSEKIREQTWVNARDELGNAPLHLAVSRGRRELIKLLLKSGADPVLTNAEGLTPLHTICKMGYNVDSMKMFFEHVDDRYKPVQVDVLDNLGRTPLHHAVTHGYREQIVRELLSQGADPNATNAEGMTPLHVICEKIFDSDLLKLFYEDVDELQRKVQIDAKDNAGRTPLHYALAYGCKEQIVRELLKRDADPRLADEDGFTPLHIICQNSCAGNLMGIFMQINDDKGLTLRINDQDKCGRTPLHYALERGNEESTKLLISKGTDPNTATNDEESLTPLHIICKGDDDNDELAKIFFESCDDAKRTVRMNAKDKSGRTPFHYAVENLKLNQIDLLLSREVDLSDFVFPAEFHFNDKSTHNNTATFKLKLATRTLAVVERLENGGYQLDLSDGLTIMKFFYDQRLFARPMTFRKSLREKKNLARQAKELMVKPDLSLYDLIRLRSKEIKKRLTYKEYFDFVQSNDLRGIVNSYCREYCAVHLLKTLMVGFVRQWALEFFCPLIDYRIPLLCCEMVVEQLTIDDLWNICLAYAGPMFNNGHNRQYFGHY